MTTDASNTIVRQTFCTFCKQNVQIADGRYVRLANNRAVIEGWCSLCGTKLIKAKLLPRNNVFFVKRKRKGLLK
jgi:hypothetical protein